MLLNDKRDLEMENETLKHEVINKEREMTNT